jgi:hypothetical protein
MENNLINAGYDNFIVEIKNKIRKSQYEAMKAVNTTLINLYWGIGEEIINSKKRAGENQLLKFYQRKFKKNFQK